MAPLTEKEQLSVAIGEVSRLWRTLLDERLRPLGLSQARWLVLLKLSRLGDGVVQKTLAGWLGIEGPTLVRLLDRMAEDGWIERRESAEDRRAKTVHLTPKAQDVIETINAVASELRQELLADVTPDEMRVCTAVLQRIKEKAEAL